MSDRRLVKLWLSPAALIACLSCGPPVPVVDAGPYPLDAGIDAGTDAGIDAGTDAGVDAGPAPFASRVISFDAGPGAGFGQANFPQIVLGPPEGGGAGLGSQDVLSLGVGGEIILGFDELLIVDGPGVDLLVFENAFFGYPETGILAVSSDGVVWHEWPCGADDRDAGYPGCAGVNPVYASTSSGISPTDPLVAGGDGFDLAALGLSEASFVRIRDSGRNPGAPPSAGFDLDGIAIVHALRIDGGPL